MMFEPGQLLVEKMCSNIFHKLETTPSDMWSDIEIQTLNCWLVQHNEEHIAEPIMQNFVTRVGEKIVVVVDDDKVTDDTVTKAIKLLIEWPDL